jgi:hypothetical protein
MLNMAQGGVIFILPKDPPITFLVNSKKSPALFNLISNL